MKKTLWAHKTLHTFVYTRVRNYQICLNHRDSRYSVALVPISGIATQVEFRARAAATRAVRRILHSGCSRKWWRTHITLQNAPAYRSYQIKNFPNSPTIRKIYNIWTAWVYKGAKLKTNRISALIFDAVTGFRKLSRSRSFDLFWQF